MQEEEFNLISSAHTLWAKMLVPAFYEKGWLFKKNVELNGPIWCWID